MTNHMETPVPSTPWHLWVVGVVMLLWNSIGCTDFMMTQFNSETWLAGYTEAQREYFYSFPSWAIIAWACGVWGGFLGALLLLFRSKHALPAYIVSFAGLIVSNVFHSFFADSLDLVGGVGGVIFTLFLGCVAIFQIIYSKRMITAGVLR